MKNNTRAFISILVSISCVVSVVLINREIALRYLSSGGKTQALFGIVELISYYYKYLFLVLSLLSILFAIKAKRKKENIHMVRIAFILAILSIVLICTRIWKIMI